MLCLDMIKKLLNSLRLNYIVFIMFKINGIPGKIVVLSKTELNKPKSIEQSTWILIGENLILIFCGLNAEFKTHII